MDELELVQVGIHMSQIDIILTCISKYYGLWAMGKGKRNKNTRGSGTGQGAAEKQAAGRTTDEEDCTKERRTDVRGLVPEEPASGRRGKNRHSAGGKGAAPRGGYGYRYRCGTLTDAAARHG